MSAPAPRAVLVTGASSGIGRACALGLDRRGFRVFAGFRREEDARSLRDAASDRLTPVRIDLADAESIETAADQVDEAVGDAGLDGLVNNAGIAIAAPLEFLPIPSLREQLEINVVGQVAVTQAFLPAIRRRRGRIVFMGSISGRFAAPFLGPYSASKHALEAVADSMRLELRPWGIHVAILEPGAIDTPIWSRSSDVALAIIERFPARAESLYGASMRALQERVRNLRGTPVGPVVDATVHALTADRPRARYVVGRDARFRLLLSYLPTRVRDGLVARALRLPAPDPPA